MAYLILDLDLMVFCAEEDLAVVDVTTHTLGPWIETDSLNLQGEKFKIALLNQAKLSRLIEHACTQHDGIIILTSGLWDETNIKNILIEHLSVSPQTKEKIDACDFLNPINTIAHYPELKFDPLASNKIRASLKNVRLSRYLEYKNDMELYNKYFVFVDDQAKQVDSFTEENVTAIRATIELPSLSYYDAAMTALDSAKQKELALPIVQIVSDGESEYDYAPLCESSDGEASASLVALNATASEGKPVESATTLYSAHCHVNPLFASALNRHAGLVDDAEDSSELFAGF